jgi:hypothetical protein
VTTYDIFRGKVEFDVIGTLRELGVIE